MHKKLHLVKIKQHIKWNKWKGNIFLRFLPFSLYFHMIIFLLLLYPTLRQKNIQDKPAPNPILQVYIPPATLGKPSDKPSIKKQTHKKKSHTKTTRHKKKSHTKTTRHKKKSYAKTIRHKKKSHTKTILKKKTDNVLSTTQKNITISAWKRGTNRKIRFTPNLTYPMQYRKLGVEASVTLLIRVNSIGEVIFVDVINTSGYPKLDVIAKLNIRKMKFIYSANTAFRGYDEAEMDIKFKLQ